MGLSMGHLVLLLIIVLVVFGAGKIPQIMGDVAKGMRAFKKGMNEGDDNVSPVPASSQSSPKKDTPTSSIIIDHEDYEEKPHRS
jgi:sec-independent protein translocase protein TatA